LIKKSEHAIDTLKKEIFDLQNRIEGDEKCLKEQEKEKEQHIKNQSNLQEEQ
jgi:hypothetical protein